MNIFCTDRSTDKEKREYEKKRADELFSTLLRAKRIAKRRAQEIANRVEVYIVIAVTYMCLITAEVYGLISTYTHMHDNSNSGRNPSKRRKPMNGYDEHHLRWHVKWCPRVLTCLRRFSNKYPAKNRKKFPGE